MVQSICHLLNSFRDTVPKKLPVLLCLQCLAHQLNSHQQDDFIAPIAWCSFRPPYRSAELKQYHLQRNHAYCLGIWLHIRTADISLGDQMASKHWNHWNVGNHIPNIPNGDVIRVLGDSWWFRNYNSAAQLWNWRPEMVIRKHNQWRQGSPFLWNMSQCSSAGIVCEPKLRKGPRRCSDWFNFCSTENAIVICF